MNTTRPILLAGIPRSGTTWVARALAQAQGCCYFQEPDNEKEEPLAYALKRNLHRYPYLRDNDSHSDYYELWKFAFSRKRLPYRIYKFLKEHCMPNENMLEYQIGQKCRLVHEPGFFEFVENIEKEAVQDLFSPLKEKRFLLTRIAKYFLIREPGDRVIVKSVHGILSLPWIDKCFKPQIVVLFRNPLNAISSYLSLKMPDSIRNIFVQEEMIQDHLEKYVDIVRSAVTRVQQMAVQVGGMYKVMENQINRNPEWIVIKHEELCANPLEEYKRLYQRLNLDWTEKAENFINASNREGLGFEIKRVAKKEIDKWKQKLTSNQISEIQEYITAFNLSLY